MKVLGVDPGTQRTGWGIARRTSSGLSALDSGVIVLDARAPLADRLEVVHLALSDIIERHRPDAMAVEDVFYAKFANAAIKLAHMRGVVLLLAAQRGLPLAEYPPAVIKHTVAGRGAAEKEQVARLVGAMLGLKELPPIDATDALALAITHLQASRVRAR